MARQNFIGLVVSQGKMNKTIKVRVMQKVFNKKVQKEFLKKKDYLVHDESNICREGDLVRIEATRPLSARKFFSVAEIKKNKGQQFARYQREAKERVQNEENEKNSLFLKSRDKNDQLIQNSFYLDLDTVKNLRSKDDFSPEEIANIKKLREKYGITSWDKDFENQELFRSDVAYLAKKIDSIRSKLVINDLLEKVLADPAGLAYKTISTKMGITDTTKKNIKKNLVRKYLKSVQEPQLKELGL